MADYIEREAAYCAIVNNYDTDAQLRDLDAIPAADVAPVVRCGECEYSKEARVNEKGFLICPASGMEITENDYCSYGVRMGGD